MHPSRFTRFLLLIAGWLAVLAESAIAADTPKPEFALSFQPAQKQHVEIESPTGDDIAKCKVQVERRGKSTGWVVYGPEGQVLRRFSDTNGDGVVDQWQYYNQGIEV
jgi:hypothetical protein